MVQIAGQFEPFDKSPTEAKNQDGSYRIPLQLHSQKIAKKRNSDDQQIIIMRLTNFYNRRRRLVTDFGLGMILSGLILMITENQLVWKGQITRDSADSYILKSLIVITTWFLIISIVMYHCYHIKVRMLTKSIQDWRVAVDGKTAVKLLVEVLICVVCPYPGTGTFSWFTTRSNGLEVVTKAVPIDVLLSLPMFLRLYLLFRVFVQHSQVFNDIRTRSIGALNNISFNTEFILKWAMNYFPIRILLAFVTVYVASAAYFLHLCEREQLFDPNHLSSGRSFQHYGNCLWLVAITFLTVGYGDVIPNTQPGRLVCVVTGFVGVSLSSILVAVLSGKLHLTAAERNVHNFMENNLLTHAKRHAAATILQKVWRMHRLKSKFGDKSKMGEMRNQQRIFLAAVSTFRDTKRGLKEMEFVTPSPTPTLTPSPSRDNRLVDETLQEIRKLREEQHLFHQKIKRLEEEKSALESDRKGENLEVMRILTTLMAELHTVKTVVVEQQLQLIEPKTTIPTARQQQQQQQQQHQSDYKQQLFKPKYPHDRMQ